MEILRQSAHSTHRLNGGRLTLIALNLIQACCICLLLAGTAAPTARATKLDLHLKQSVVAQIDTYRSLGAISPQQMDDLQSAIAQLREADRRAAMSKLIRTMNAGEIKGRL